MKLAVKNLVWPALLIAGLAAAETEERWFQVEIMLFKNPAIETDTPEVWPAFTVAEQPESYIELLFDNPESLEESEQDDIESELSTEESAADNTDQTETDLVEEQKTGLEAFKPLPEEERQLIEQAAALSRGNRYQLLFHEAWNQPVPDRNSVIPIKITGGEQFGRHHELHGFISLYVERYLHLSTDLHLVEYELSSNPFNVIEDSDFHMPSFNSTDGADAHFLLNDDSPFSNQISHQTNQFYISVKDAELKESRRMRSRQIHYFDNPEFGMLVLITPIDIEQQE